MSGSPSAADFAQLVGAPPESPVELRSLENFFARHTTTSDPYDSEAQGIRPRYEELARVLSSRLRDVRVYRLGKIEISCYVAGLDAHGNLAGLRTVAIET
jgi:Nuclease A inhibitor-like protein